MTLKAIVRQFDDILAEREYADNSNNGLQVENSGRVAKIACGVDASLEFFREAHARGASLCIVHHGMSWDKSLARIEGVNYEKVRFLMEHDMALYASHIPLDAHSRFGNNVLLAKGLGLCQLKRFAGYHGNEISFWGTLPRPMGITAFAQRFEKLIGNRVQTWDFGKSEIRTVGVVSGGGGFGVAYAMEQGLDAFVTGEAGLADYNLAKDGNVTVFLGGHYATEGFGPKALGEHIAQKAKIPCEFIDLKIPY